jgi:hypothetical protein
VNDHDSANISDTDSTSSNANLVVPLTIIMFKVVYSFSTIVVIILITRNQRCLR